jgi:protein-S-isoprenylcysteine O-methyltransferase Ste14
MRILTLWQLEQIPWLIFAAYWAITWLRVKPAKERERSQDRLITLVVGALAFTLLFGNWQPIAPLRQRFLPHRNWIAWSGVALTWMGVTIAIWARYCLGEYWSARVTLKQGHQLIRSGPYRWVRHPIYAGMLLGCVGAALVVGEWRGVVAVVLIFAAHSRKALREESLLTKEFGEEYLSYRRHTGFLLPRWRNIGIDTGTAGS